MNPISSLNPDVLVAGAGPAGLMTALLLAEKNVSTCVIDAENRPAARSYALALHPGALQLLDRLGLAEQALAIGRRIQNVLFYDRSELKAKLDYSKLPGPHPYLIIMPQDELEGLLLEQLRQKGVEIFWNHRLSKSETGEDGVEARVDQLHETSMGYVIQRFDWTVERAHSVRCRFLVGADGANSYLRRLMEIDYPALGPTRKFAVYEVAVDQPVPEELRVVFGKQTVSACWPLEERRCRWSFEIPNHEPEQDHVKQRLAVVVGGRGYKHAGDRRLARLLHERAPWFQSEVQSTDWSVMVQFGHHLAESYGKDRCWLVGDAAHMTGPVGVQSMNVGFSEAARLADALAGILHSGGKGSPLEEYNRVCQKEWKYLLGLSKKLKIASPDAEWLKPHLDRLLDCIPASGDHLEKLLGQLNLAWEKG